MKAVAALMLMIVVVFALGCTKEEASSNSYNGHEYVDLGLPSGTLWATCNVGATTSEGYGDCLAWGETKTKIDYDWNTYKYCNGGFDNLIKYCTDANCGYNGFTDNLTILQPEDDAATANWGKGWRMPTYDDWDELFQNTTNAWITQNGVNGRRFTGSNGNSLFLPAAGLKEGDKYYYVGKSGYYWLSSSYAAGSYSAWIINFSSHPCGKNWYPRFYGLSIRPVRSAA